MTLNKATGDMYEWVTHTWNPIAGECYHRCKYCYVKSLLAKPVLKAKYSGAPRLALTELRTKLGKDNTIFVQNMGDLFAMDVPGAVLSAVMDHIADYPDNTYLLQTKDPERALEVLQPRGMKPNIILGTTIETNTARYPESMSKAPRPTDRAKALSKWQGRKTVTIEPIMLFDLDELIDLIKIANPKWVSIGADSCGCGLPEPAPDDVKMLIIDLQKMNIEIKLKKNLKRIMGD